MCDLTRVQEIRLGGVGTLTCTFCPDGRTVLCTMVGLGTTKAEHPAAADTMIARADEIFIIPTLSHEEHISGAALLTDSEGCEAPLARPHKDP